jgi:hypothetical protein
MEYAENLLNRYRNVTARVQRGVGGERVAAENALRGLEEQYPGIGGQAFPPAPPANDAPYLGPFSAADNFGKTPKRSWKDAAQEAMGWAARVAAEVAAARDMEGLASHLTEIHSKNLSGGKFQIAVKFPSADLGYHLSQMDAAKRASFVERVTALFREELAFVLDPENGASYDD